MNSAIKSILMGVALMASVSAAAEMPNNRPAPAERLFTSPAIEGVIAEYQDLLTDPKLRLMFTNCFPNTLDTTVHFRTDSVDGKDDTFVYTGDIHAMWLRDSGAQVWPYIKYAKKDPRLQALLRGVINRQFKLINTDPFANAFNDGPKPDGEWQSDRTTMIPEVHERKWEIDSHCYPIRLAYAYWKETGDTSIFDEEWIKAIGSTLDTFTDQQMKDDHGSYRFERKTERALDSRTNNGMGNPVKPCGLIASAFRPSDDATTFQFLVPSNFMAVSSLNKAAEILNTVNNNPELANRCSKLANEVASAIQREAIYNHPKYGPIYAFEVDGFGNHLLMDDANVPSLLAMAYLGDVDIDDPVYQNTRRFVWSEDNPYFFRGKAGEGIGGPHVGYDMVWPMSIMMRAFTSTDDEEIAHCIRMLMDTDAGLNFIHESFNKDDATNFTRPWFAWQNSLFGELIIKLVEDGKLDLLNNISRMYTNPVVDQSLPDPTVMRDDDGTFYLYATENIRNVPIYKSSNLVDWEYVGTAFTDKTRPKMVPKGGIWAPDINKIGNKYVMYFSKSEWAQEWDCGIGRAVADSPEGPFTDAKKLFISNEIGVQNSIDPFYIETEDGKYLFWGSFSGIYGIELSNDGLSLKKGAKPQQISGKLTEGTYIHKRGDYYYLFGSTGTCCEGAKSTYRVVVARSKNLFGPYVNRAGESALDKGFDLVMGKSDIIAGPGHNSEIVTDNEGRTWMFYHGFELSDVGGGRKLFLDEVKWDEEGWPYVENHRPSIISPAPSF